MFDADAMRKRFHDLGAQREAILAAVAGATTQRDAAIAAHEAVIRPLEAEIKAKRAPLYNIDQERALISRALAGKTGAA